MTNRTAEYYNSLSGGGGINSTTFSTHSSTSTTTLTSVFGRNQNNPQNNPQNNQQSQITPQILTAPTSTLFPPQSTQTLTNSLSIYLQDMSRMRKRMIRENNVVQIQHTQRANTPLFPPNNTKPFTQTLQTGRLSSLLTQDYLSNAFLDPNSTTKTWLGIYQLKMKQFKHLNLYDLDLRGLVPNPLKLQAQLFRMALEVNHVKNEFHFGTNYNQNFDHSKKGNNSIWNDLKSNFELNNQNIKKNTKFSSLDEYLQNNVSPNNIFLPGNPSLEGKDTFYALDPVVQSRQWSDLHHSLGTPRH
jgi:hypothetical protein